MGNPGIIQRKFTFCSRIATYHPNRRVVQCLDCTRFFATCCPDDSFGGDLYQPENVLCHHFQLVFIDGACSNNGQDGSKAGLGIAIGDKEEHCWSIIVDDTVDPGALRTNQRAELLAAIEGLKKLVDLDQIHEALGDQDCRNRPDICHKDMSRSTYIIVTDSEYVVKGITEWFPTWCRKGWRTADGRPTNLDLFLALDDYCTKLEQERIAVGFLHVPRAYNRQADRLAKLSTDN